MRCRLLNAQLDVGPCTNHLRPQKAFCTHTNVYTHTQVVIFGSIIHDYWDIQNKSKCWQSTHHLSTILRWLW